MMKHVIASEIYRWIVLGALGALIIIVTGISSRNVYSRDVIDEKDKAIVELHNKDIGGQQRQLDRIERNVEKLVDRLIDGEE